MTPERWLQVKEIFSSALAVAPEERSAFLLKACGTDKKLRAEVESLIASHERDGSFIDSPVYKLAAAMMGAGPELTSGQQIGRYKITRELDEWPPLFH